MPHILVHQSIGSQFINNPRPKIKEFLINNDIGSQPDLDDYTDSIERQLEITKENVFNTPFDPRLSSIVEVRDEQQVLVLTQAIGVRIVADLIFTPNLEMAQDAMRAFLMPKD